MKHKSSKDAAADPAVLTTTPASTVGGRRSYGTSPPQQSGTAKRTAELDSELESSTSQPGDLSDAVRRLMRHVPYPVAVITATDLSHSPEGGPEGWRGATVSSFNTVALLPRPVVSFNIKKISSTFDAIRSSGHFYVHLLSEDADEAHKIASKFTKGNASYPFHDDSGELESFALVSDVRPDLKRMPPILHFEKESGDLVVPFRLHCRFLQDKLVEIGDHVVLFGEVDHVFHDVGAFYDQSSDTPISCLVYVDGSYCRVAVKSKMSRT
ncbi:hypothetical protein A1O1_05430 [Capronia coronata CBS 617.96]|uniref:Flavin reductase like domain-containing protein n=1 Tax=Capronia coronata CBS 617.96 TaxID=1182541 RepID=W9YFQ8_9EURO|nr:uncharacterized protein A1O1_05430 [Capronia coronata CBS 617.96]EXJ88500.1 hypothetical protein A1O1_05430 [Capronia coronata CBS 617.96]